MSFDFTPEEEDQMYREFAEADQRALRFRATASPQLASTVGQLYANNRDANPGVLLPAAQAVSSGRMTPEQAEKLLADTQRRELDAAKQEKKKKSWWERNVSSKVRTASRWTMATLNFVPQTVTGAAAQLFDTNDNVDGWFISTDLGTLIANDEVAGDGYFLGGRAAQLQAERARRYRGEIDGKAWTIGRGFASVISQPGSREYNILSGLVDAVSAVAIPAAPGLQAAKAGVAAAGARAGEVAGVGLFTKSAAGLLDAERAAIDPKKVRAWIDSRGGAQAVQKVADVKTIDEAMQMFPKVQDAKFWLDVIDADDPGKARTLLLDNLGYGVDEFDLGDRNFVARIAGKSSRVAKLMASVPGQHVVLQGGNARDVAQSVKNVDNYLRLFSKGVGQPGISDEIRQGVVTRFARAITTNNGDVYSTMEEIDTITKLVLKSQGVPDEAITSLMAKTKEYRELSVYGALNEAGEATSFGAKVVLPDGRVMIAPTSTAGLQSEMMNQVTAVLPDPRRVRRMVGDLGWVMGKGKKLSNPENYRELRMPASALEFYQNELWRPLTLMTPGYVLRNMTDSAFRLSFTPGLKGGVYHPLQWIQMALHKRYRGTLTGEMFDDAEGVARAGMEEYARATGQGMREALDPLNLEHKGVKDRLWAAVNRQDKSRYRKGLQDEISLLHDDPVAQLVARGELSTDEIVKVLRTEDWGKKYVEQLQNRWRNKAMVDTATGQTDVVTADFLTNDTNLRAFVDEYIGKRVSHIARGNEVLRRAIADGKVILDDGTEVSLFKTTRNGTRYDYTDEWTRAAERVIDDPNVELSPWLKTGIETKPGEIPTGGRQRSKVFAAFDKVTDKFFGELYPKRSAFLMQSPVFRQYYYQKVGNLLDELDPTEVPLVREALEKAAAKEGKQVTDRWLAQYVGDSSIAKRLKAKLEAAPKEPEVSVAARPFAGDVPVINAPENAKVTKFEELDKPMYTGQPISFTLYRGYGSPKEVKGTGSNAILGRALYATPDFDYAAQFAGREIKETVFNPQNGKINIEYTEIPGTVAKIQVELKNPMVIVSEPSGVGTVYWNDLVKEAGWEFAGDPRQAGRDPLENIARLRELIESKGHDGVIIRIWKDKFGYRQSALRDVAAGDQVVVFPKATPNVPEKAAVSTGLSLSELDAYAKGFALDSTKELFYNAAEKSNFADILRVVVPFGSAWAEVISSWTKIAASNPEALKRLGVSVEGLRDADPDNDGRGFFWKDPQTGEYVFNYPFNKQLGPLTSYFGGIGALGGAAVFGAGGAIKGGAAGLAAGGIAQSMFGVPGVELQAPARTLNMGLNLVPGLGPMAQIAASRILGKLPAADDVRRFLTPYGEPELTVIPSWMQKVQDAVQSPESNRMLGDMKIETMRVLAMTGEYDLSNEADKERLENDADSRARTLLMLRALGQFVGPTRPSVEFKVETYAGDVYGSELSKAFRDFQSANYDTAVETFMQVFGDDAFLYMAGKTRSAVGGLDASKEFGNFERDNRSLFARYKDVAGYFAPTGSNFDYQVYLRQLATGQREKLKPSELVAEAQALVGRSIYRNVVRMAGPYPSTEQRDYLRMVRQDLQQRFPGYAYQPMVFNRLESQITQILAAVGDDILDGNPVAEATRIYMDARDQALQEAVNRGFTSLGGKNVADLRAWLRNVADGIIVSYPQFERIYDRVLFNEIDLDAGE